MELSEHPLVSTATSRGISRGSYGLKKSAGNLSAKDGAVSPSSLFGLRCTSSGVKWGQILVQKMLASSRTHIDECSPVYLPRVSMFPR